MNRNDERELFLKYIVDAYLQNPNLPVSRDIIYNELSRFSTYGNEHYIIDSDSLVGVQVRLNNKFKSNSKVRTFTSRDGYFWAIENRCGKSDNDFFADMYNSIKLYVSVDPDNIYKVSELLFNFMIKENIIMQCKISKSMRNDALVCRVSGEDAARKVSDYLNSLYYDSKFRPNPFLLDNGKVSMTMDGRLSYNIVLAKLLEQYFSLKRMNKQLDKINCNDFNSFVKNLRDQLCSEQKKSFMDLYSISNEERCKDFIMICSLISRNLDGSLSFDKFFKYDKLKDIGIDKKENNYSKQDEDKLLYVINGLANYYSVNDVHKIIMKFIETGDYKLFTRKEDIRIIIYDNFAPIDVKNIISNLGWNAFIYASKVTYDKYGEDQLFVAVKKVFSGEGINGFTNDYDARSRLGLVIPQKLLINVMISKLNEAGRSISNISLMQFVLEEIGKLGLNKSNGRK